mmetsp:Transcript_80132/g.156692  ORF Transcript_80132/g.156692 Transcript_80132/m.156692 type:complete len:251 (-) Transcript_80132:204-956(-)
MGPFPVTTRTVNGIEGSESRMRSDARRIPKSSSAVQLVEEISNAGRFWRNEISPLPFFSVKSVPLPLHSVLAPRAFSAGSNNERSRTNRSWRCRVVVALLKNTGGRSCSVVARTPTFSSKNCCIAQVTHMCAVARRAHQPSKMRHMPTIARCTKPLRAPRASAITVQPRLCQSTITREPRRYPTIATTGRVGSDGGFWTIITSAREHDINANESWKKRANPFMAANTGQHAFFRNLNSNGLNNDISMDGR